MNNEKHLSVFAVNDESGDATFWNDGFVYVVDESKLGPNGFIIVPEVDDKCEKHYNPEALIHAVSLKDLVQAAIDSGLMDTLQRKTRFNRELD